MSGARADRWTWILHLAGIALIAWGVLHVSSAGYGELKHDFAERRSYDQVKRGVHGALLGGLARAVPGLILLGFGARRASKRSRAERSSAGRELR